SGGPPKKRGKGSREPLRSVLSSMAGRSVDMPAFFSTARVQAQRGGTLGVFPSPLWGGGRGGGRNYFAASPATLTPLPNPPPQEGREQARRAAFAVDQSRRNVHGPDRSRFFPACARASPADRPRLAACPSAAG